MLSETQSRYSCQLRDMQYVISHYEDELTQLRHDLERQNNEYKVLLGIKTHLEKEKIGRASCRERVCLYV